MIVEGTLNFSIANKNTTEILFNVIALPPAADPIATYNFYNCYMRAAFEGLMNKNCYIAY